MINDLQSVVGLNPGQPETKLVRLERAGVWARDNGMPNTQTTGAHLLLPYGI